MWQAHKTRLQSFSIARNANLPTTPSPALFTSLTALPFVDPFSLRSRCLQADFPDFTRNHWLRVGTRGWGLAAGAGDEQKLEKEAV